MLFIIAGAIFNEKMAEVVAQGLYRLLCSFDRPLGVIRWLPTTIAETGVDFCEAV